MSDNVFDLTARLRDAASIPADGPPAITFDFDGDGPVTFRDQAALDAFVAEAVLAAAPSREGES